jgi:hypothetical protein
MFTLGASGVGIGGVEPETEGSGTEGRGTLGAVTGTGIGIAGGAGASLTGAGGEDADMTGLGRPVVVPIAAALGVLAGGVRDTGVAGDVPTVR